MKHELRFIFFPLLFGRVTSPCVKPLFSFASSLYLSLLCHYLLFILLKDVLDIILHYVVEPSNVSSVWEHRLPYKYHHFLEMGGEILPRCKTECITLIPNTGVTFLGCTLLFADSLLCVTTNCVFIFYFSAEELQLPYKYERR